MSIRTTHLLHSLSRPHGTGDGGRTVLRVYTDAHRAGEVWIWLWLAALNVVGGYVARCGNAYSGACECFGSIDVRGWDFFFWLLFQKLSLGCPAING